MRKLLLPALGLAVFLGAQVMVVEAGGIKDRAKVKKDLPDDKRTDAVHEKDVKAYEKCSKACSDCARECEMCAAYCAKMVGEGHKHHIHTLHTCMDCATHCTAAASITARAGVFSDLICLACADACARCAKACEHQPDDEHMARCAKECRQCEAACREMMKHIGSERGRAAGQ